MSPFRGGLSEGEAGNKRICGDKPWAASASSSKRFTTPDWAGVPGQPAKGPRNHAWLSIRRAAPRIFFTVAALRLLRSIHEVLAIKKFCLFVWTSGFSAKGPCPSILSKSIASIVLCGAAGHDGDVHSLRSLDFISNSSISGENGLIINAGPNNCPRPSK